jgi:hypothetical protein
MTHAALIQRAAAWLRGRHKCIVVLTEHTGAREQPDAIGWRRDGTTVLVECKTNVSDFRVDRLKPWRRGLVPPHGRSRWYLLDGECWQAASASILRVDSTGWGIAWAEHAVRVYREAAADPSWTADRDAIYLIRELQRFQIQGMKPATFAEHDRRIHPPIDGTKVSIPIFDAALDIVGCSRREIEQALAAVAGSPEVL